MEALNQVWLRLKALAFRRRLDRDLEDELSFHLELREERLRDQGTATPETEARKRFGNRVLVKEVMRDSWTFTALEELLRDSRLAVRSLRRAPAFSCISLLTIGLAAGGLATVFAVVNGVLLRPLPYPESHRLVQISELQSRNGFVSRNVGASQFLDWRSRALSFESMALVAFGYSTELDPETQPERVSLLGVSSEIFPLLGVRPALGRLLLPEDEEPNAPGVALISYDLWQSRFGKDTGVIGQSLSLFRRSPVIVGVMPQGFEMPFFQMEMGAVYEPIKLNEIRLTGADTSGRSYTALGRLASGASVDAANREFARIVRELAAERGEPTDALRTEVAPLLNRVVGETRRALWLFFGAASCVFLIAIIDLTGLQGARNAARRRDVSLRAALGAGRLRLMRGLVVESLLIALAGGTGGFLLAWAAVPILRSSVPAGFPRTEDISIDWTVLLFVLATSCLAGLVVGVFPAIRTSRPDPLLKEGMGSAGLSPRRTRSLRALLAGEAALALVLLLGAGLLTNSLWQMLSKDSGIEEQNIWTSFVTLPLDYRNSTRVEGFWDSLLERVGDLPGVVTAGFISNSPPLAGFAIATSLTPLETSGEPRPATPAVLRQVDAGLFPALGVPILRGRNFGAVDGPDAPRVAIVNEALARASWPGESPIGKQFRLGPGAVTVVGEASDFQQQRIEGDYRPQIYYPRSQFGAGSEATVVIKTSQDMPRLGSTLNTLIAVLEPEADVATATLAQIRWRSLSEERLRTAIVLSFAGLAVLLALVGIFGVVAYSIVQRRREIGLRMALGAMPSDVRRLMLAQAMTPVLIGLSVGLAASLALTRFLESFLFEITPTDPATFAITLLLFLAAASLASFLPARRAARIDPMETLRYQ